MSWTSPRTWVAGEILTAALLNTHVRDNELILKTSIASDGALIDDTESAISVSSNTITLDLAAARHFAVQLTANVTTTTLQNIPASGKAAWFVIRTKGDGSARTWSWFTSTVKWGSAVVPTVTATLNKFDYFMFLSYDGGTTWYGFVLDQNFS